MGTYTYKTIERVSAKIRYKLETYIDAYTVFVTNNLPQLQDYYSTPEAIVDATNFTLLDLLMQQAVKIDNIIKINRNKFNSIDEWELVASLEDIKVKLDTYNNLGKWMRSSKTSNSWRSLSIQTNYTLGQGETLEQVESNFLNSSDEQNDWVKLSLENNLMESDYTVNGGNQLKLAKLQSSTPNFFLNSVVDNLVGFAMYGKDIYKKLTFEDDDIKTLNYNDTLLQSVDILVRLIKNDVPQFPNLGVDNGVGSNVGTYTYSSVVRQMNATFATDDTLKDFTVNRFFFKDGDIFVEYSVNTFLNKIHDNQITKIG